MIVTKRRRAPQSQNYRGVWSGLGAVPPPNYEQCNPFDSACVARNAALEDAYNLALLSETRQKQLAFCLSDPGYSAVECHKQFDPGGILDQTANAGQGVVTFAAPTLTQAITNPLNPTLGRTPVNPLESRNAGRDALSNAQIPVTAAPTVPTAPLAPLPTTPQGQVIGTSSGTQTASGSATQTPPAGFGFSSVPWYVWAGGAVAAFYFFGGQHGR